MKTSEVLKIIPGISRYNLYQLEKIGALKPKMIRVRRNDVREYSEGDVRLLRTIMKYYNQGFAPKMAYDKALEEISIMEKKFSVSIR